MVIGGGPAGASAARCLAAWGHSVALYTRPHSGPSIAESLPPSCLGLFDRIGVRSAIENAGFIRATGNTVWWGAAPARAERFGAEGLGFQVDRAVFDELLLAQAERAGVVVRRRALVRGFLRLRSRQAAQAGRPPELQTLRIEDDGAAIEVTARWVLDCTGRTGLLARQGSRLPVVGARTLALVGIWENAHGWALDDETHTLVESYANGWAWSVPLSATRRCFTVMVDPSTTPLAGSSLAASYHAELARTTHLSRLLTTPTLVGHPWARDASAYSSSSVGEEGRLLVGDAASFVDPLSSFGVKKAMASAWLAAVVVNTCLQSGDMTAPALELHESRERAMYDSLMRQSAMLARDAVATHGTSFWTTRAGAALRETDVDVDVMALREDPDVIAAFQEIRGREALQLRLSAEVAESKRPTVVDNRIFLDTQLVAPAFPLGIRYLRNVDLIALANIAVRHAQVGEMYDAYCRDARPVGLPDFLGALSVLVGKGLLINS